MSEIQNRTKDSIDKIISELRYQIETEHYDFHYDYAIEARNKILALEELAVVDREAELPKYTTLNSHDEGFIILAQQDMIENGWVKEIDK